MKSSFVKTKKVTPALIEQRTRLLTAVVSARQEEVQNSYLSPDSASSRHPPFIPFSIGRTRSLLEDEASSDKAVEDAHIGDSGVVEATASSLPIVLPWKGPSRLASIVESDEEDEQTFSP
jgi:hypothetical protein